MGNIKQPSGCGAIGQQYALSCCWLAKGRLECQPRKIFDGLWNTAIKQRYMDPDLVATGAQEIALDCIKRLGNDGHFFGTAHTQERYSTAFYQPFLSEWSNFEGWEASGALWTPEGAHALYQQILAEFEPPALEVSRRDALADFVARRKREGGAPTDF